MSLINDALKRARQAQQKNPPPPEGGPPLRPVENAPRPGSGKWWFAVIAVVVLILAVALFWPKSQTRDQRKTVSPPAAPPMASAPVPKTASALQPEPVATAPPVPGAQAPEPQGRPETVEAVASAASAPSVTPQPEMQSSPTAASNAPTAAVEPAPPPPAPYKLQGILYRPAKPVAVINGKTVGVGDRIGDALVVAITRDGAFLVVAGETNTLSLPR